MEAPEFSVAIRFWHCRQVAGAPPTMELCLDSVEWHLLLHLASQFFHRLVCVRVLSEDQRTPNSNKEG